MLYCNIRHTKIGYTKALNNHRVSRVHTLVTPGAGPPRVTVAPVGAGQVHAQAVVVTGVRQHHTLIQV